MRAITTRAQLLTALGVAHSRSARVVARAAAIALGRIHQSASLRRDGSHTRPARVTATAITWLVFLLVEPARFQRPDVGTLLSPMPACYRHFYEGILIALVDTLRSQGERDDRVFATVRAIRETLVDEADARDTWKSMNALLRDDLRPTTPVRDIRARRQPYHELTCRRINDRIVFRLAPLVDCTVEEVKRPVHVVDVHRPDSLTRIINPEHVHVPSLSLSVPAPPGETTRTWTAPRLERKGDERWFRRLLRKHGYVDGAKDPPVAAKSRHVKGKEGKERCDCITCQARRRGRGTW